MKAKEVPVGKVYGRLIVLGEAERPSGSRHILWKCRCECGTETVKRAFNLKYNHVKSCGCLLREHQSQLGSSKRTHGEGCHNSSEYHLWNVIKQRCTNPRSPSYPTHGDIGISVCDRWSNSFEEFLADVGRRPTPQHVFKRIAKLKGYEPDNVKWFAPGEWKAMERTKKTPTFKHVTALGKSQTISEWARETGIGRTTIYERIRIGWSEEKAVTLPVLTTSIGTKNANK